VSEASAALPTPDQEVTAGGVSAVVGTTMQASGPRIEGAGGTSGRSVLSGALWSATSRILPQLYTVIISVVAARSLGPSGMGQQSFIAFAELSAVMLFTGGLPISVMRYVAELAGRQEAGQVRALLRWTWAVEAVGALLGAAVLVAVALTKTDVRSAWLLAAFAAGMSVLHNVPSAALIGLQRWRANSVVGITTGALSVGSVVLVLNAGGGLTGMFAVEAAISVVNLSWTSWLARRAVAELPPMDLDPSVRRSVTRYGLLTSISVLLTYVVWSRSEFFFLERYSSQAQIAQYSIAFGAATALLRLSEAAAGVLTPAVANLLGAGESERLRAGVGRSFRLVIQLSLGMAAAGIGLGPLLVQVAYGEDYAPAAVALTALLVGFPLLPVCTLAGAIANGLGRVRITLVPALIATVVNLTLDALLIPGSASFGAAIANTTGQLVAGVPVLVLIAREVGGIRWERHSIIRGVLVAAGSGLVARVIGQGLAGATGLLAGGFAGLSTYLLLTWVVRPLPLDDARWLAGLMQRLGPGVAAAVRRVGRP